MYFVCKVKWFVENFMQNDKASNKIPTIGVTTTKSRHTDEGRYPLYTNRVAPNLRWGDEFLIIPSPKSWRSDSEDG